MGSIISNIEKVLLILALCFAAACGPTNQNSELNEGNAGSYPGGDPSLRPFQVVFDEAGTISGGCDGRVILDGSSFATYMPSACGSEVQVEQLYRLELTSYNPDYIVMGTRFYARGGVIEGWQDPVSELICRSIISPALGLDVVIQNNPATGERRALFYVSDSLYERPKVFGVSAGNIERPADLTYKVLGSDFVLEIAGDPSITRARPYWGVLAATAGGETIARSGMRCRLAQNLY